MQSEPSRAPTARFSDRVEFYLRYRPRYPQALVEHLAQEGGLLEGHTVADMGCGTGFLAEVFLRHGCAVIGIEPNANMRAAGESLLAEHPGFKSVDATSESTGLPDGSVDWITAGQAFHWFDAERSGAEFRRILRPGGRTALVWNDRDAEGTPFMKAYDTLLHTYAPDYQEVGHRKMGQDVFERFFRGNHREVTFPNGQAFDREALRGRLLSSSYAPPPGHPNHDPMIAALDGLFDQYATAGPEGGRQVAFQYQTRMFWGELG